MKCSFGLIKGKCFAFFSSKRIGLRHLESICSESQAQESTKYPFVQSKTLSLPVLYTHQYIRCTILGVPQALWDETQSWQTLQFMSQPDPTLQAHEAGVSKCSRVTEQASQHRDSNTSKNLLTAELWGDSLLLSEGARERDNIFAVLALEVIRCLQKGLSCVHTLWSKLMFVYRDCKAGGLESRNVSQYYLWSPL